MANKKSKQKLWIFQSNPDKYDLLADLKTGKPDPFWSANQHRDEMRIDDRILFRVSGRGKGIYATGTIKSSPFPKEDKYGKWKVSIRFDALIDPPLLRAESNKVVSLKNFGPLIGQEATNFIVPAPIAKSLEKLISKEGRVLRRIEKGVIPVPIVKPPKARIAPSAVAGRKRKDQEHIRKVEQAGVKAASGYLFKLGFWLEEDCQLKGVGYDFVFRNESKKLHVEVKGISGPHVDFNLTPKELRCAKNNPKWKLILVLNALGKPKIIMMTGSELLAKAKYIEPTQYRVIIK
jgi:hypothetical protein